VEDCTATVSSPVSLDLNEMLSAEFVEKEINLALAQMHPLKSQGLNGFGVSFFQYHWGNIGDEVRKSILNFLNGGTFDPLINDTFITLIPKNP
jgi:hypothetical protein